MRTPAPLSTSSVPPPCPTSKPSSKDRASTFPDDLHTGKDFDSMLKNSRPLGHILALFVAVVWGTTFISTKLLLDSFHPVEIMIFRFVIAWVVLFLCSPKPLLPKSIQSELPFLGAGLMGLTLYFVFENTALTTTMASTVGIIISSTPMFTALLLWVCRRTKRPKGMFFLGFLIAMAGITLISLAGGDSFDLNPSGILLTLGAAVVWGAYGVCIELTQASGLNDIQVTRKVFFWGILTTIP
ncbi:MAG: DMT family transporter, partial [Clostridia bacterium]|nr:DMT family transporter [Clostridia bacterium]